MVFNRLSDEQVNEAADILLALRRKELVLDNLPERLIPQSAESRYL